jgi:hypothetical protein
VLCLTALLAGAALACAAGTVVAWRFYVGTIGNGGSGGSNRYVGSPIRFQVSADGKRVTGVTAAYTCLPVGHGQLVSFPNANIVNGAFKTTLNESSSVGTAAAVIEGHFVLGGGATGTITGTSEIPADSCHTTNPWSVKAQPRGFGICASVHLYDATARYITEEHIGCKQVTHEIRSGYEGQGDFTAPSGWKCGRAKVPVSPGDAGLAGGGRLCRRASELFQFAII